MNTHPTHTQVGGWGLQQMVVPTGIGLLLLLLLGVWVFSVWVFFRALYMKCLRHFRFNIHLNNIRE